ncbi:MAG: acyl-CoA dehydrogenase C-terminal domain-containing protein [Myxococcales bacterium]|nr:acyl-CoA dehydrogenase C-terminal domain-containing protein [Myxococcales bacterium]
MPAYKASIRDIQFVLHEMLEIEQHYARLPGGEGLGRETIDAMISEVARFMERVVAPLNRSGDEEGCHWSPEGVRTPAGFKEAYDQYYESGFGSIATDEAYGGQGLPPSLRTVLSEMVGAANSSFSMYPGLTAGAIAAIQDHGSEEQKQAYLPKMNEGVWSGTMCLTESHCGTDLGLLRTKAEPLGDGSYAITGEKIFISAGEHDLTENIIHLVLARLPDAPAGTKGISLFIVPKLAIDEQGNVGDNNGVQCASLEHKMGIKASATCVMAFENARGVLLGEPNKGLRAMFTMMNHARLATGMQGMALGVLSFQGALEYAKERLQMRSLTGPKAPDKPADPIIVHPDVRRMLLTQKVIAEGSRAMAGYCSMISDLALRLPETEEGKHAEAQLELLTPICKAFMTDLGSEACNLGVQVFGGHGYIREQGMEQMIRDGRVLQIYEGANGIQALDLLGRKVLADGGARLKGFIGRIEALCEEHRGDEELKEFIEPLERLHPEWVGLVSEIMERALQNPDEAGAASYDFLSYSGYVSFAYFFAWSAAVAKRKLREGSDEAAFYEAKLLTARFYVRRILPRTRALVETMRSSASDLMDLDAEHFSF